MPPKTVENPRQIPSKHCGCSRCFEKFPEPERRATKGCTGTWQARYYDPSGRRRGPCFDTKKEAQAFLDQVRTEVRTGEYQDPKKAKTTVAAYYARWAPTRMISENSRVRDERWWKTRIEPRWGTYPLRAVDHLDVRAWVNDLSKDYAPATVSKIFQVFDGLMTAAVLGKMIKHNPCDSVPLPAAKKIHPEDRRPPTSEQVAQVLARLPAYHHALVITLEETGLRWGEAVGLRRCHLDLRKGKLEVREVLVEIDGKIFRQAYPKTGSGFRTVPLTPRAVRAIEAHLEGRPAVDTRSSVEDGMCADELVFRGRNGRPLSRNNFRRIWVPATEKAGIARTTVGKGGRKEHWPSVHDLRHGYASRLANAGVPEIVVQEALGHERAGSVTWAYTHSDADAHKTILAALQNGRALRAV